MITIQEMNGYAKKLGLAYEQALLPLSRETGIPYTALGILLFFANNPDLATARDVCALRGLKRANVSAHVERLVREGLLERKAYPGDRRKETLVCTEKAQTIIERGRRSQEAFTASVICGLTEEEFTVMKHCFLVMSENIDRLIKPYQQKGEGAKC